MQRDGVPRPRPDAARRPVPAPSPARRPAPARLQPVVDLASAARGRCSAGSTAPAWARYRNPVPLLEGPVALGRAAREPGPPGRVPVDPGATSTRTWPTARTTGSTASTRARSTGPIAYFCAEYGFHESLGIYSGGLGVLAGDHMKSASDMALPFVGVGLLYRKGYFRQTIDADGHQEHAYPDYDLNRLPLLRRGRRPTAIRSRSPSRCRAATCTVAVWVAQVGRVPVLLLDTDLPENADADRPITNILYVRGREMRLHQELVLGVGGVRAIRALGLAPAVWHLNEGHSAFLLAERARELVADGRQPRRGARPGPARRASSRSTRPVSAGNERFDADLVRRVAGPLLDGDGRPMTGGVPVEPHPGARPRRRRRPERVRHDGVLAAPDERRQRGQPAARARRPTRPGTACSAQPILGITNGVHVPTWVGTAMARALPTATSRPDLDDLDPQTERRRFWERMSRVPDAELWRAPPAPEAGAGDLRPRPAAQPVRPPRRGARRCSRSSRTRSIRPS